MKTDIVRQTLDVDTQVEPRWVASARQHYERTGGYRPEDVRRILGNPGQRVEVSVGENTAEPCCKVVGPL